jgi:hypothetical protein
VNARPPRPLHPHQREIGVVVVGKAEEQQVGFGQGANRVPGGGGGVERRGGRVEGAGGKGMGRSGVRNKGQEKKVVGSQTSTG